MFCGKCGAHIDDDSKFCRECGAPVIDSLAPDDSPTTMLDPTPAATPAAPATPAVPVAPLTPAALTQMLPPTEAQEFEPEPEPEPQKRSYLPIIVGIIIAVLVVGGIFGFRMYSQHQQQVAQEQAEARANAEHPVTFAVELPTTNAMGPIPVSIQGETQSGESVQVAGNIKSDGTGIALKNGSYTVHVIASPLVDGGITLTTPDDVTIALGDLDPDASFTAPESAKLVFGIADPAEVTDDQIQASYSAAIVGGISTETANSYRDQVEQARADTISARTAEAEEQQRLARLGTLDINDAADYAQVNLFLSNFVEWPEFVLETDGWSRSFDRSAINLQQMANWAMWHLAINNEGVMLSELVKIPGATGGLGNDISYYGADQYPRSVDAQLMSDIVARYTGMTPDFTVLEGRYQYYQGRVFEGYERGAANPLNTVALAKRCEPAGEGLYRIDFTAYRYGYSPDIVQDKSWYGLGPDELIEAMRTAYKPLSGQTADTWSGTAVVEVQVVNGERKLQLVTLSIA